MTTTVPRRERSFPYDAHRLRQNRHQKAGKMSYKRLTNGSQNNNLFSK